MNESIELKVRVQSVGQETLDQLGRATAKLSQESKGAEKSLQDLDRSMSRAVLQASVMGGALLGAANAMAAAAKAFTVDAAKYAARTETLTVVMDQMARVNHLGAGAVRAQAQEVKKLGITTQESMSTINKMIFAQLDLKRATDLARVAQNAAVIAGVNSSEALSGIIHGIVTRQPEVLRTYGIIVDFENAYTKAARARGRELAAVEKQQIAVDEVLKQSAKINGVYEVSMLTAGKQMASLSRQFDEAKNAIGEGLVPVLSRVVDLLSDVAKYAEKSGEGFSKLVVGGGAAAAAFASYKFLGRFPLPLQAKVGAAAAAGLSTYLWFSPDVEKQIKKQGEEVVASILQERESILRKLQTATGGEAQSLRTRLAGKNSALQAVRDNVANELAKIYMERGKGIVGEAERLAQGLDLGQGVKVTAGDVLLAIKNRRNPDASGATFDQAAFDKAVKAETDAAAEKKRIDIYHHGKQEQEREREAAVRRIEGLERQANEYALSGIQKLLVARDEEISRLQKVTDLKLRDSLASRANAAFELEISREKVREAEKWLVITARVREEEKKAAEDALRFAREGLQDTLEFGSGRLKDSIRAEADAIKRDMEQLARGLDQFDRRDKDAVQRQANKAMRVAELRAGPGGEIAAVEVAYQRRVELARELYEIEIRRINRTEDAEEKQRILMEARYEREKAEDEARTDRELRLLELRKRSAEQYRDAAGKVFDALTARGGGGLKDFVTGQIRLQERAIFQNLSEGIFRAAGGALGRVGQASGLGWLLKGTLFDPANAQRPEERLAKSQDRLRQSVDRLTVTMAGGAGGPVSAALAGSGAIASIAPGEWDWMGSGGPLGVPGVSGGGGGGFWSKLPGGSTVGNVMRSFGAGMGSIFAAGLFAGINGKERSIQTGDGQATTASALGLTTTAGRIGNIAGSAAVVGAAALGVREGIREGGLNGALTAAAAGLGAAALIPGPQQPFIGAAAGFAAIARTLRGDPKKKRAEQVERMIRDAAYEEPGGMEYVLDTSGMALDYNKRGEMRSAPNVTIKIEALDAKSILDRAGEITDAVRYATGRGHDFKDTIKEVAMYG